MRDPAQVAPMAELVQTGGEDQAMAIVGTNGPDTLQSHGTDVIRGLGGADTLSSIYDDTLEGGAGNDLLQATSPFSTYNGWASYEEASGPVHVSLTLTGPQAVGADQGVDTLVNLGGLIGSAYNDVLSAGPNDVAVNPLLSMAVDPQIYGGGGADSLIGGAGNDSLYGEDGDDTIDASNLGQFGFASGGAGNDVVLMTPNIVGVAALGGDGDDRIYNAKMAYGGNGADTMTAGHAPGSIVGAALYGEAGDDSLVGSAWADEFYGGAGRNTIIGGGGGDFIHVFDPSDGLLLTPPAYQNDVIHETGSGNVLSFEGGPSGLRAVVDLSTGTAHVDRVSGAVTQRVVDLTFDNIQIARGSSGDDSIQGSSGDDTLLGFDGTNTMFGGDGNDSIAGGSGHNQVNGNKGDDTIVGGSSVGDWLLGGQGNDSISASGNGANIINGNMGDDTITAGWTSAVTETIRGGQGDDVIHGGGGGDLIFGDLGHNTISGGGGADTFVAGAGHDVVTDFKLSEHDHVLVSPGVTWQATQSGGDILVTLSNGGDMLLQNVQLNGLGTGWIGTS